MKARKLTAQAAIKLLARFYEENGKEATANSFGWEHAPDQLGPHETLFSFEDQVGPPTTEGGPPTTTVVGFGIIEMNVRDAADTEARLSAGVFKDYRRRGYWHAITDAMIVKAKKRGADYVSRTVNRDNEEHYQRSMREAYSEDSKWIHAGDIWFPTAHGYFVYPFDEEEVKAAKAAQQQRKQNNKELT